MKPIKQTVAAGDIGAWIPINRKTSSDIGFTVHPHTSSAGTYDVNFTASSLTAQARREFSRSTTTLTITVPSHGLTTTDACIISGNSDFEGQYEIASVTDANNVTVTVADSGAASGQLTFTPLIVDTVTDFSAASGLKSGNVFATVTALRLDATSVTTADIDFLINQY